LQQEIIEPEDKMMVKQTKITDWYDKLVFDLKKLAFEGIVSTKWKIGYRILKDELKFNRAEYGSKSIENLAKDLESSTRDLYYCINFANTFPKFLEEIATPLQNLSWRRIIKEHLTESKKEKIETPSLPEGKYQIIYADPAWKYWSGGWKNQEQHYSTMDIEEIKNLKIQDISDENCILFLWATFPYLKETIEVMECWGFKYSTVGFVWVKKTKTSKKDFHFGCGSWTRANVEPCLIGVKGTIERKDASISQIIYEPVQKHSKKPSVVRDKITKLVGDLPRIELFAREKADGWDSWGNEV